MGKQRFAYVLLDSVITLQLKLLFCTLSFIHSDLLNHFFTADERVPVNVIGYPN